MKLIHLLLILSSCSIISSSQEQDTTKLKTQLSKTQICKIDALSDSIDLANKRWEAIKKKIEERQKK